MTKQALLKDKPMSQQQQQQQQQRKNLSQEGKVHLEDDDKRCATGPDGTATTAATRHDNEDSSPAPRQQTQTSTTHPQSNTATAKITTPRLYIGNLHPRVTAVHLESLLSKRGLAVEQVQFVQKPPAAAFCFVTLASVADAARAISLLHRRQLCGRPLVVQPAHSQQPQHNNTTASSATARAGASAATTGKEKRKLEDQIQALRQKLCRPNNK